MPKIDLKKAIETSGGDELDYLDLVDPLHWECYCGACVFYGESEPGICSKHPNWKVHSLTEWNYKTHMLRDLNKKCDDFYN